MSNMLLSRKPVWLTLYGLIFWGEKTGGGGGSGREEMNVRDDGSGIRKARKQKSRGKWVIAPWDGEILSDIHLSESGCKE